MGVQVFRCEHFDNPHQLSISRTATCINSMLPTKGGPHPMPITAIPGNKINCKFIWSCLLFKTKHTPHLGLDSQKVERFHNQSSAYDTCIHCLLQQKSQIGTNHHSRGKDDKIIFYARQYYEHIEVHQQNKVM